MRPSRLIVLPAILTTFLGGCAHVRCATLPQGEPDVAIKYATRGPVGLGHELDYYSTGELRFLAPNNRVYCGHAKGSTTSSINRLLKEDQLQAELRTLGENLRFPSCYLSEYLTISIAGVSRTARIDALQGILLHLAGLMDSAFKSAFGQRYDVLLVERATEQQCEVPPKPRGSPRPHVRKSPPGE